MRFRAVLSIAVLALSACSTMRSDPRFQSIDWSALEVRQEATGPLVVSPEIDLFALRIPLVTVEKQRVTGSGTTRHTEVEHPTSPVGVSFGNALALDSEGNLFLDVLTLMNVDLSKDFDLRFGPVRLFRAGGSLRYFQPPLLAATVGVTEQGTTVKAGTGSWGYTWDGTTYAYTSSGLLGTGYEVTPATDSVSITVARIFATTYTVSFSDQSATFSPYYKVTKSGDTYLIEGLGSPAKSYKLYYAGSRIIFCEGETVLKDIQLQEGAVLVDGRKTVTLSD